MGSPAKAPSIPAAWLAAAILLSVAAVFGPTLAAIEATWRSSETFAHGYVVLPVAAVLAWMRRDALARLGARPWWPGLALVAVAGFAWLLGQLAGVNTLEQAGLYGIVVGALATALGTALTRAFAFPLGFLAFAIPFGDFLVPVLIEQTARFTVGALQLTGIPVYREGNLLLIPSGRWSVVEACSGVRYLLASLMAGTLYAGLAFRTWSRRLGLVALSVAVPIVANWLRAYLIVMLAHLTDNRLAIGVDHFIYGWVFFGAVLLLTFWIGSQWREPPAATAAVPSVQAAAPAGRILAATAAAVLLAVAWRPLAAGILERTQRAPAPLPALAVEGWEPLAKPPARWRPGYRGAAQVRHRGFRRDGGDVGLYLGLYGAQRRGRELVAGANTLVDADDPRWRVIATAAGSATWDGRRIALESAHLIARDGTQLAARRWYWVNGRYTASDVEAKAWLALDRLRLAPDHAAVIVVYTPRDNGSASAAAAAARLDRFSQDAGAAVGAALAAANRPAIRPARG